MSDSYYFKHKNSLCLYCARFKACHIISPVRRCFVLDSQFVIPKEVVSFIRYKGAFPDSLLTDTLISKITSFNKSITEYFYDERERMYDS